MLQAPKRSEIDHRTIKLVVGLIALSLANLTSFFADKPISSISASYYQSGWSQDIFVGFLFAIAAFLLAYNGLSTREMVLSKVAAFAALGVAMFPCGCDGHIEILPHVHMLSAAAMFVVLACFCFIFYQRARSKGHAEAQRRAAVYALCGATIVVSILLILIDFVLGHRISAHLGRLTFYCERSGLMAFGASWLTASRVLPFLASEQERFSLFRD